MLTLAAALCLLALPQRASDAPVTLRDASIPVEGVWSNQDGFYVSSPTGMWYVAKGMHGLLHTFSQVPDQTYLGRFGEASRLTGYIREYEDRKPEHLVAVIPSMRLKETELRAPNSGYARITYGPKNGYGKVAYVTLTKYKPTGPLISEEKLYPVAPLSEVRFGTKYLDKNSELAFKQTPYLDGSQIEGTLSYLGKKLILKGLLVWGIASFALTEPSTGAQAGSGMFIWNPSESKLAKFMDRDYGPTDQVLIEFTFPGVTEGKPLRAVLKRAPDA